jgi:hypothetical protein
LLKKIRSVPKVAMDALPQDAGRVEPGREESMVVLCRFRREAYCCLETWVDELFELTDALLCTGGPVRSLAELCQVDPGGGVLREVVDRFERRARTLTEQVPFRLNQI